MSSKKKKYNCRFPPARIKKIMQADEEVGKVAAVVPLIISRALELFVESLLTESSKITRSRNARTLTPSHLKACITSNTQFSFLRDFVSIIPDIQTTVDDEQSDGNSTSGPSFNQGSSSSTTTITTCTMPLLGTSVSSKTISRPHRTTASNSFPRASNRGRGRPRKVNVASTRSQDDDDGDDDDDDDDDEEENDINEGKRSENKSNQVRQNDDDDDYETLDEEEDEGSSCDNSSSNTSKIQPTPPLLNQINSFALALNQQVEDDDYDN